MSVALVVDLRDERTRAMSALEDLLRKKCEADQRVEMLGMQNVAGRSSADRLEIDIGYQRARDRATFARDAYDAALKEFVRKYP